MIFVTGGTGLVGAHLLFDLVKQGEKVKALIREGSSTQAVEEVFDHYAPQENLFEKVEWVTGDITDIHSLLETMQGVTKVYHCAAVVSFHPKDKDLLYKMNVEGTANVVNAALELAVEKLCFVSSTAAVGKQREPGLVDENNKWTKFSETGNYVMTKRLAEMEVWRAAAEGLNMVIVNPCLVLGPGKWGESSTSVITSVWEGLKFYTDGGNAYVDARDVSSAMIQLMNSDISNERFLLIGENLPFKTFFDIVAKAMNKKGPTIRANKIVSKIGVYVLMLVELLTGRKSKITRETRRGAHSTTRFSNQKVKDQLGFEFRSIDDAVENTVKAFLKTV